MLPQLIKNFLLSFPLIVKFEHWKITSHILSLIVQRQPIQLSLDFCTISKQQLTWLLPRIPQTRGLSLQGIDYPSCVLALASVNTPMLQELDLSFVTGLNDGALFKILSSPRDSRPGMYCFLFDVFFGLDFFFSGLLWQINPFLSLLDST